MNRFDVRDIIGGLSVVAIGIFFTIYSMRYNIGTIQHMGPGYFPLLLSIIFIVLGVVITIPAFFRAGTSIEADYRNVFFVTAATVAFALSIRTLGIFPSTLMAVVIVGLGGKISFRGSVILGVVLSILTYLVFIVGLGMNIPRWPRFY